MAISLVKNQTLSLQKSDGGALTEVSLGLGWDAAAKKGGFFSRGGGSIDLDASAILLDASKNVIDSVWFGNLKSADGSIQHSGDNLTGDGDGDDEKIQVDLTRVHPQVQTIVLVVTSYQGQTFDKVANVFARVVDISGGRTTEVVRYDLSDTGTKTGSVIAKLARSGSGWSITALGNPANGKTAKDLVSDAQAVA
ncbi:MAG: TerD family protein [Glaciihabitans sp.]|nr:TerD family protein [Glaciihabitans sp.]